MEKKSRTFAQKNKKNVPKTPMHFFVNFWEYFFCKQLQKIAELQTIIYFCRKILGKHRARGARGTQRGDIGSVGGMFSRKSGRSVGKIYENRWSWAGSREAGVASWGEVCVGRTWRGGIPQGMGLAWKHFVWGACGMWTGRVGGSRSGKIPNGKRAA